MFSYFAKASSGREPNSTYPHSHCIGEEAHSPLKIDPFTYVLYYTWTLSSLRGAWRFLRHSQMHFRNTFVKPKYRNQYIYRFE
jgi:hypothetical protein